MNQLVRTPGGTVGRVVEKKRRKSPRYLLETGDGGRVWVRGPLYPVRYPPCAGCGRIRVVPPETKCGDCQGMYQDPVTKLWRKP